MAQVERQNEEKRANKRANKKEHRSRRRSDSDNASFIDCDYAALLGLVCSVAEQGGAVRLGYTRDGGAFAVGVYLEDDYATEYIRPSENFTGALTEIAEAWLPEKGLEFHRLYNLLKNGQEPR